MLFTVLAVSRRVWMNDDENYTIFAKVCKKPGSSIIKIAVAIDE